MKKEYIFYILISVFFAFTYYYALDLKLDLNGDNANYLRFAGSIANGHGYSTMTTNGYTPVSHYPPGYSFFLSIFMLFGIKNLVFFKILNGLLLLGSLLLLCYISRKTIQSQPLAFTASFLAIFSPLLLHFSGMAMSEMLFLFLSVVCIVALFKYTQQQEKKWWKSYWFYLAIACSAGTYYVRTVGMATFLAVILFFLFRKEWKQAICSCAGMVVLILPWIIRNSIHNIESRYFGTIMTVNPWRPEEGNISSFGELIEKMLTNFDETVIKGFKEVLFPFMQINYSSTSDFFAIVGGLLIVVVIFYGAWQLKPIRWALIAYMAGHIGLFMLWHGGNGARYVVPIAPFIFVCFYAGIYAGVRKFLLKKENSLSVNFPYAFLILVFFMFTPVKSLANQSKQPYPLAYQNYFNIAKEMQKQLSGNKAICCCRKPELFMYYAPDIYAINYVYSENPDDVIRDLIKKNVTYVVLEQLGYGSTPRYLFPAIKQHEDLFSQLWHLQNPDTFLLSFNLKKAKEKLP